MKNDRTHQKYISCTRNLNNESQTKIEQSSREQVQETIGQHDTLIALQKNW